MKASVEREFLLALWNINWAYNGGSSEVRVACATRLIRVAKRIGVQLI